MLEGEQSADFNVEQGMAQGCNLSQLLFSTLICWKWSRHRACRSLTRDLWDIAGVKVRNGKGLGQGGKPGTGKLYNDVCLCGSAHSSGCMVDGLVLRTGSKGLTDVVRWA